MSEKKSYYFTVKQAKLSDHEKAFLKSFTFCTDDDDLDIALERVQTLRKSLRFAKVLEERILEERDELLTTKEGWTTV